MIGVVLILTKITILGSVYLHRIIEWMQFKELYMYHVHRHEIK